MAVQTATTFAEAFMDTADRRADDVALRTKDDEVSITWEQWRDRSSAIAAGLHQLGLERGQCVGILLGNRPEFHLVDIGVLFAGGTPFSIYQTSSPEQIQYVVTDADARILVTEPMFLPVIERAREELPNLEHIVVVAPEGDLPDGCMSLADLEERGAGAGFDLPAALDAIAPEDTLTLIYTSGTTGPPKGVQLSHRNLLSAVDAIEAMVQFDDDSRVVSWLPSAHIAERAAHHYLPIRYGIQVTSCPDPKQVISYLPAVQPTWFFAVPRVWEKLKAGLEAMLASQPEDKQQAMKAAIDASTQKIRLEQRGEPVPDALAAAVAQADEQVFAGIREMLGLSSIKAVNVGAAPTPVEVIEFFHAIGVPLAEIWGMSETCGAGAANRPGRIRIGTVGEPAPGFEIKLAEDGEVLVRADAVMVGYRNMPDKTAETVDAEGWLHSGDIGEFDEEGYLKIVDRKKELIINAAGKNMSPSFIEATLKSASPLIGQACVIGDARSYNTALIVLDADFAPMWAQQQGIEDASLESLAKNEQAHAAVQAAVDAANAKLSRVEQIKKFVLVQGDWLPGGDELTPTMKLKRKPIGEKYGDEIEAMYSG
ncbi:MAG: AMP-dependent synthetase/ligase [Solirubrobacteraceae bacterium]